MSACTNCTAAAQDGSRWGGFTEGCRGCCARSIARDPSFFAARQAGGRVGAPEVRKYLALLEQVGGLVSPPITHDEVRAAAAIDEKAKVAA